MKIGSEKNGKRKKVIKNIFLKNIVTESYRGSQKTKPNYMQTSKVSMKWNTGFGRRLFAGFNQRNSEIQSQISRQWLQNAGCDLELSNANNNNNNNTKSAVVNSPPMGKCGRLPQHLWLQSDAITVIPSSVQCLKTAALCLVGKKSKKDHNKNNNNNKGPLGSLERVWASSHQPFSHNKPQQCRYQ